MNKIPDINWLYYKYYSDNPELRRIVTVHSEQVAKKAWDICRKKNLPLNHKDVYLAAMLHDIGVVNCYAPSIHAYGDKHYLRHGIEGKLILEKNRLEKYASICVNHTGAGITKKEIRENKLPLPEKDMVPKNLLEKLICYSDKFFSKSGDLTKEKDFEEVVSQIKKFGPDSLARFMEMHTLFSKSFQ